VGWDVVWQPGHVAIEGVATTADDLKDGRETSCCGDLIVTDKLVPFDLQQLSLALHIEGLESTERRVQVLAAYNNTNCNKAWYTWVLVVSVPSLRM